MSTVVDIVNAGNARKKFAATAMNDRSSRSHTAFIIQVSQGKVNAQVATESITVPEEISSPQSLIRSQFHLVDLAGSERVKKSKVTGGKLKEAVGINYSLLVLGKCIASLVENKSHVPYYESKLTTLLKSAFGGNSKTTVVINCRPEDR